MDKSAITMTADDDWWLERVTMDGEQRYPERIRVGSLDGPRVYVPERTCRPGVASDGCGAWGVYCPECGHTLSGPHASRDRAKRYAARRDIMPRYCPHCGARVVSV